LLILDFTLDDFPIASGDDLSDLKLDVNFMISVFKSEISFRVLIVLSFPCCYDDDISLLLIGLPSKELIVSSRFCFSEAALAY
jgi:hypothetical protein